MAGTRHIAPIVSSIVLFGALAPAVADAEAPRWGGPSGAAPAAAEAPPGPADAAAGGAGGEAAQAVPKGLAQPDGESWGDEWFDERAREEARAFEQRLLEEAAAVEEAPPATAPAALEEEEEAPAPAARRILLPPRHRPGDIEASWRERREALLRQDRERAAAAERRLFAILRELDVPEVRAFGAAAMRESRKLEATAPAEALASARLAVRLAPSLPAAHLQLLRAQLLHDPLDVARLAAIAGDAASAFLRDPRSLRLLALDLGAAAAFALVAAGAVILALLSLSHARAIHHDFHHLFPRGISTLQTALLACMLLLLPLVAGLGPAAVAGLLVAALWRRLERGERLALGVWVALLCLLPIGAARLAAGAAWDGTPAAALEALERDGNFAGLEALEARVAGGEVDPETLFVVARAKKRLGDLPAARRLYERALDARPSWREAMVNLGNVRFLQGDLDGAEELYTRAIDRDPGLAAAYFDLSRVHYDRLDLGLGQAARARAMELDPALAGRYGPADGPVPANAWLVDLPLDPSTLAARADRAGAEAGERVGAEVAAALFGPLPPHATPIAGALLLAILGLAPVVRAGRRRPASTCTRCGRPVCAACDPEAAGGAQCGQCLSVFEGRVRVDGAARERKERAVRVHRARRRLWRGLATATFAGPFVHGAVFRGALLLLAGWFLLALALVPRGLVEPLHGGLAAVWKVALLAPPLALCVRWTWRAREGR